MPRPAEPPVARTMLPAASRTKVEAVKLE